LALENLKEECMKQFLYWSIALACWWFWEQGGKWVLLVLSLILFLRSLDTAERDSAYLDGRVEDVERNIEELQAQMGNFDDRNNINPGIAQGPIDDSEQKMSWGDLKTVFDGIWRKIKEMDAKHDALEEHIVEHQVKIRHDNDSLQEKVKFKSQ
jgi:phage shock protein A|tara:strand:+ start:128 stop:589 length:462 start_codon:yes stop_codon:yes gene_type:complete